MVAEQRGVGDAGADAVDADALARVVYGEHPAELQNGQRRFVGKLLGLDEDHVLLSVTNRNNSVKELTIPFKKVARAELVLTDDLIRDTLKKRKS